MVKNCIEEFKNQLNLSETTSSDYMAGACFSQMVVLAHNLANGPTRAIRWTKLACNKRLRDEVNMILDASLAMETISMLTEDHKEAARAFTEKRAPEFKGY